LHITLLAYSAVFVDSKVQLAGPCLAVESWDISAFHMIF